MDNETIINNLIQEVTDVKTNNMLSILKDKKIYRNTRKTYK